ncbi:MAG: GFA family protein [Pseudomonadota bacterium]
MTDIITGRCLCGAVRFEVHGRVEPPVACHCIECQRQSGAASWISVTAPLDAVTITRDRLAWVFVSDKARRGFCRDCGGFLFWEPLGSNTIDIAFGALDRPHGLHLSAHIYTAESRLPLPEDGLPRYPAGRPGIDFGEH